MMILVGLVLMGGIKRIADVAGKLVPLMAAFYIASGLLILGMNAAEIPAAFSLIVSSAFTPVAAQGALPVQRFGLQSGSVLPEGSFPMRLV